MRPSSRQRGIVIVYASLSIVALMAVVSLAVDWGRVQMAKTELQNATDAAARYAATGIYDSTYITKAQAAALQNNVDGSTLAVQAADVKGGHWDTNTKTFTANGTPTNAIRVVSQRTAANGNALPLWFGRAIGMTSVDVRATSIARQTGLALVGIDWVTLSGNSVIQRLPGEPGGSIIVASNGPINVPSNTTIAGDIFCRVAPTIAGTVTGRTLYLPSNFSYSTVTVPPGTPDYGSIYFTGGSNPVSGNVYASGNVYFGGSASVTLYGNTNLYCGGTVTFTGSCVLNSNGYTLTVYSLNNGAVEFSGSNAVSAVIYAPNSNVTVNGPGIMVGSVVGKTVTANTTINYTDARPVPVKASGGGDAMTSFIATVR